ncbi:heme/hemin ABC transporter substrate-binding protein [Aestuariispira insulae]|uniref:Iron complex transport system substrate-binding protein n=1 Tax=Aestuariispira insulae TaxID=1461337 RepID=A0A3D9H3V5_9PROT|nr:ABC transporter substrate-binding protein [Aestuariispira insulae]RED44175.1 iron complex transport system substrate-binding protein [Aestuariispira insulae]
MNRRDFLLTLAGTVPALMLASRRPALAAKSERIVSIGGAVTETVAALGAADRLVAVDTTSRFPVPVQGLPQVGYLRTLAAEGILSMGPTKILASALAGPKVVLDQLAASGLLQMIPDKPTADGVEAKIRAVGEALDLDAEAEELARQVLADMAEVNRQLDQVQDRPKVAFLHNVGRAAPLTGGRETPASAIIELARGQNAFADFAGYKTAAPEAMIAAAPDAIIMTGGAIERFGGMEAVLALPHVAGTPAGKAGRIIKIDRLYMLGFGPRTAHAAADLAQALHPKLDLAGLPERAWTQS